MKRTPLVGAAARRRIKAGGPLAKGRPSLPLAGWNALKASVFHRAGWRCENCKRRTRLAAHHIVKRSQGGEDTAENLAALCSICHDRTDRPHGKGRLTILRCVDGALVFLGERTAETGKSSRELTRTLDVIFSLRYE